MDETGFRVGMGHHVRRTLHVAGETFAYRIYALGDNPELIAQGRHAENSRIKREMNALPHFPCDLAAWRSFARGRTDLPQAFRDRIADGRRPFAGQESHDWDRLVARGKIADPETAASRLLACA